MPLRVDLVLSRLLGICLCASIAGGVKATLDLERIQTEPVAVWPCV